VIDRDAQASVAIPERFNGPPESANGGFTCGTVARLLGTSRAEVSLRRPPPLDRPMSVERADERVALEDRGETVAEGAPSPGIEVEPPRRVGLEEAERAGRRYPWLERHVFPTCFVCGPDRPRDDGLAVFTGPVDDRSGLFAATWVPAREWSAGGKVREEIVWAALDCPSAVPVMPADPRTAPAVLARLTASIEAPIVAERPHVIVSWRLEVDGRKRHSASALLTDKGEVVARARALWIVLRR